MHKVPHDWWTHCSKCLNGVAQRSEKTCNYNITQAKDGDTEEIYIREDPFWQKCLLVNVFPWKENKIDGSQSKSQLRPNPPLLVLVEVATKKTIAIQNMINQIIIGTINQQWKHLMKPSCSKSQLERGIDQWDCSDCRPIGTQGFVAPEPHTSPPPTSSAKSAKSFSAFMNLCTYILHPALQLEE